MIRQKFVGSDNNYDVIVDVVTFAIVDDDEEDTLDHHDFSHCCEIVLLMWMWSSIDIACFVTFTLNDQYDLR